LWSAGCSTGEEPYSLALLVEDLLHSTHRKDVFYGITATDISLPTLAKAKLGIYNERKLHGIPEKTAKNNISIQLANHRDWQIEANHLKASDCFCTIKFNGARKSPI
jgi:type IV pilus assembly protein PilK